MIDLGIITWDSIAVSGWLFIPAMAGAVLAPMLVKHINQKIFESMIWFFYRTCRIKNDFLARNKRNE